MNLVPAVAYRLLIYSNGCFPKNTSEAEEAGYYEADLLFRIDKEFADNRKLIEIESSARPLSQEELVKASLYEGATRGQVFVTSTAEPCKQFDMSRIESNKDD